MLSHVCVYLFCVVVSVVSTQYFLPRYSILLYVKRNKCEIYITYCFHLPICNMNTPHNSSLQIPKF